MSEFLDALTAKISDELAGRPSSVRGRIIQVGDRVCTVEYPNPAGGDPIIAQANFPLLGRGLFTQDPEVGQYVTLALPQGSLAMPSIIEFRYPNDDITAYKERPPRNSTAIPIRQAARQK